MKRFFPQAKEFPCDDVDATVDFEKDAIEVTDDDDFDEEPDTNLAGSCEECLRQARQDKRAADEMHKKRTEHKKRFGSLYKVLPGMLLLPTRLRSSRSVA